MPGRGQPSKIGGIVMKEEGSKVAVVTAGGSRIVVGAARELAADGFQIAVLP